MNIVPFDIYIMPLHRKSLKSSLFQKLLFKNIPIPASYIGVICWVKVPELFLRSHVFFLYKFHCNKKKYSSINTQIYLISLSPNQMEKCVCMYACATDPVLHKSNFQHNNALYTQVSHSISQSVKEGPTKYVVHFMNITSEKCKFSR